MARLFPSAALRIGDNLKIEFGEVGGVEGGAWGGFGSFEGKPGRGGGKKELPQRLFLGSSNEVVVQQRSLHTSVPIEEKEQRTKVT
jgi:hypothetical protein